MISCLISAISPLVGGGLQGYLQALEIVQEVPGFLLLLPDLAHRPFVLVVPFVVGLGIFHGGQFRGQGNLQFFPSYRLSSSQEVRPFFRDHP